MAFWKKTGRVATWLGGKVLEKVFFDTGGSFLLLQPRVTGQSRCSVVKRTFSIVSLTACSSILLVSAVDKKSKYVKTKQKPLEECHMRIYV